MTNTNGCHQAKTPELRKINFTFDNKDADQSARRLVQALSEVWRDDEGEISFVRFTEGITNTLTKATKRRPGQTDAEADDHAVLIRAYGNGTDVLIDRERELRAHTLLASFNLAPPLQARFNNGLIYSFVRGSVCSPEDLTSPRIYQAVARRLAEWHATLPIANLSQGASTNGSPEAQKANGDGAVPLSIWSVMRQWIDALPTEMEAQQKRVSTLTEELTWLFGELGNTPGLDGHDYIFGHCDLLSGNVIIRPTESGEKETCCVDFIDYEYATPAPAAFDIANHFAEWVGFKCDYSAIPTHKARLDFLESYVKSFREHLPFANGNISNADLSKDVYQLDEQVNLFRGVPGFYWGIWSLIQAQISQIDFDYANYADLRLGEYWDWKAEYNGSREREGTPRSLREQRWAEE